MEDQVKIKENEENLKRIHENTSKIKLSHTSQKGQKADQRTSQKGQKEDQRPRGKKPILQENSIIKINSQ